MGYCEICFDRIGMLKMSCNIKKISKNSPLLPSDEEVKQEVVTGQRLSRFRKVLLLFEIVQVDRQDCVLVERPAS